MVYKILRSAEWREATATTAYRGSADDRRSGFIHFSTAAQLEGTLKKHFQSEPSLKLLAFEADKLPKGRLRWEKSRGGKLFPHLYAPLDISTAQNCRDLSGSAGGAGPAFGDDIYREDVGA